MPLSMMDTNDQLSALFAAALEQQEAAKAAVDGIVQERAKLAAAIDSIKNASSSLQTITGAAASKAITESLSKAPKTATEALRVATEALDNAADRVRDAAPGLAGSSPWCSSSSALRRWPPTTPSAASLCLTAPRSRRSDRRRPS